MSKLRCYIMPFDDDGAYTSWQEVTDDVDFNSIGTVSSKLEGSDYDVGVFTFGSVSLKLNNVSGKYSDVGDIKSIFKWRRSNSKVKITWQKGNDDCICHWAVCGDTYPYAELTILEGLLNDEALTSDLRTAAVTFKVLSYASIFKSVQTPYSDLSNGDTVKEILTDLLAETEITKTMTVTAGNIDPQYNSIIDDVSDYEDTSVYEVIEELLVISNSVLYFKNDTLYITDRTPTAAVQQTFYGQASQDGLENIQDLKTIRSGLSRTFNMWRWEDTALSSSNTSSIDDYGLRTKELGYSAVTNNTRRQAILDSYKDEFGNPKREFNFSTALETTNREMLDRINIDYPTPFFVKEGDSVPVYGLAVYGAAKYPFGEYGMTLETTEYFKIMSIKIDLKKDLITYGVREI